MKLLLIASLIAVCAACSASNATVTATQGSPTTAAPAPSLDPTEPAEPAFTGAAPTATEPIAAPTAAEPAPPSPIAQGRFSIRAFTHIDSGQLIDGEYVPDYPEGAQTWRLELDLDVDAEYAFVLLDAVAEPGDSGCIERLETPTGIYTRSTFDDMFDFEPVDTSDRILDTYKEEFSPDLVSIWELLGIEPRIEVDVSGTERQVADLDQQQVAIVLDSLPAFTGDNTGYQDGRLETRRNESGRIVETRIVAHYEDAPRTSDNGALTRVQTLTLTYHEQEFSPEGELITPDTPILRPGGCKARTAGIAGRWGLISLIGGDELPASLLEQVGDARVSIGADGSLSGSFGCRTFSGRGEIGFASIERVSLEVQGTPCTNVERTYEDALVDIFGADMRVGIDLEDRLFVSSADGEPAITVAFGRLD